MKNLTSFMSPPCPTECVLNQLQSVVCYGLFSSKKAQIYHQTMTHSPNISISSNYLERCVSLHTHMHIYTCVYMYVCVYTYMHMCAYIGTYMHTLHTCCLLSQHRM